MQGKLYGVGVGPGDPELLTLKAVRVLNEVDYICTPQVRKDRDSLALSIIKEKINCKGHIIKLNFPMTYNQDDLNHARNIAALKIRKRLNEGNDLAFITIGDPLFYSTYIYILARLKKSIPDIRVETIPGITSISACTATYNLPLAENNENIAILSEVKDENKLEQIFKMFNNTVVMKLSRNYQRIYKVLDKMGLKEKAIVMGKCGLKGEFYTEDLDSLEADEIEYLSLLISKQEVT